MVNDLNKIKIWTRDKATSAFRDYPDVLAYRSMCTRIIEELCEEVEQLRIAKVKRNDRIAHYEQALGRYADSDAWRTDEYHHLGEMRYDYRWVGTRSSPREIAEEALEKDY